MKKQRYSGTKQWRRVMCALIIGGLAVSAVYAQQPAAKKGRSTAGSPGTTSTQPTWRDEPDGFMGLKFGQPIADQMQECPKRSNSLGIGYYDYDGLRISREQLRCFKRLATHLYEIENPPSIGIWIGKVTALVADGNFEGMSFILQHFDSSKALELFKARYGRPSKVERQSLQTRGGANITGLEYTWSGSKVTILLSEYGSRVDEGSVYVHTKTYEQSRERDKREEAQKHKDKL